MAEIKPRFFDTYIAAPFIIWYAMNSKGMKRLHRRILFSAGAYVFLRNYGAYQSAFERITQSVTDQSEGTERENA